METEPNLGKVSILSSLGICFAVAGWGSLSDTLHGIAYQTPAALQTASAPSNLKQSKYFPDFQEEKPLRNQ